MVHPMESSLAKFMLARLKLNRIGIVGSAVAILLYHFVSPCEAGIFSYKDGKGGFHFTDDISKIPEKFRNNKNSFRKHKEAIKDTTSPPEALTPIAPVKIPGLPVRGGAIEVPLTPSGNNYLVDVVLNNKVNANLILDTGASLVDISAEIAEKLGYFPENISTKRTFNTANGVVKHPIVAMPTVKVGNAQSILVDASINENFKGMDGLLGMSFLGDYKFEIDRYNKALILKPLSEGEMEWGGKPGSWWKKRFNFYNESIKGFGRGAKQLWRNRDSRAEEYKSLVEYYKDVKMKLENQARTFGVPKNYR